MTDRELVAAYVLGSSRLPSWPSSSCACSASRSCAPRSRRPGSSPPALEALPADAWPGAEWREARRPRRPRPPRLPAAPSAPRRRARDGAFSAGLPTPWRPSRAALVIGIVVGDLIAGGGSGGSGAPIVASGYAVRLKPLEAGSKADAVVHVRHGHTVELDARGLPDSGSRPLLRALADDRRRQDGPDRLLRHRGRRCRPGSRPPPGRSEPLPLLRHQSPTGRWRDADIRPNPC